MKRRLFVAALFLAAFLPNAGCMFFNAYDSDPNVRVKQMLNQSEDLRQIREEKSRFWFTNQPSGLSYDRLSGAIGPGGL